MKTEEYKKSIENALEAIKLIQALDLNIEEAKDAFGAALGTLKGEKCGRSDISDSKRKPDKLNRSKQPRDVENCFTQHLAPFPLTKLSWNGDGVNMFCEILGEGNIDDYSQNYNKCTFTWVDHGTTYSYCTYPDSLFIDREYIYDGSLKRGIVDMCLRQLDEILESKNLKGLKNGDVATETRTLYGLDP